MIKKQIITSVELKNKKIKNWPIWTCGISEFEWEYDDRESCYIIAGEGCIITEMEEVSFNPKDYIVFSKGLKCRWKVFKPVVKHYKFGK